MLGAVGDDVAPDRGAGTADDGSDDDADRDGGRAAHVALVERLYREGYGDLVGLATLVLGSASRAEDVVQDAFAGLHRRSQPLSDPDAAVGYLRRSVVNGARSALRRQATAGRARPLRVVSGGAPDPADGAAAADDARAVAAALLELPLRQRECAVLHFQLGLTHTEVADALGVRPGSVKTHLHRAARRLSDLLEDRR